jgi:hypothetical protein
MVDVVCVNWGKKYGIEYTYRLLNMVKRNTTRKFNFYCLTDAPEIYSDEVVPIKLVSGYSGWWNKMQLFRTDILPKGHYLYFDLDVVIVDNIDQIFDYSGFGITRDFVNPNPGILGGHEYNSSVMKFSPDASLWRFFQDNLKRWMQIQKEIPFFGDQNVISAYLNSRRYSNAFPDYWIWSYKIGTLRGRRPLDHNKFFGAQIPQGGKICVFHGQPNPSDIDVDWVLKNWR